ncbi:DUF2167 domain-containing protein [Saccharophagus sp. K07]|jgi:uncharacterized membrane-anchored protein|uniref:DUF2167 domain-containing protein n=1 Tax=Saccharophagus sp. K07 TaxID=2283636 RepID=UPI001651D905|nr:DUF2167 domain-containing protein [Saccharophagus sp. K07]MBC6906347.1 DUF2167 domain-containing protein [Saccharophagus sp. K07]
MTLRLLLTLLLLTVTATARAEFPQADQLSEEDTTAAMTEDDQFLLWAMNLWSSLKRQTGEIKLPEAGATLHVPEGFYYLNAEDAEKVLVEVWGNPPGQDTLGMLMPADVTPFEAESWAVTIEYEQDGYVSDDDADSLDYQELLKQMKADTAEASKERVKAGYEPIELVGWASPPFYDKATHKLHWAKELKFGDMGENTLNYNIRVLGRKGVLVLNFIAGMEQKAVIDQNLDAVLAMAEFDQGSRYADFNPDLDKVAAYGLGALVAGKVLAKTGFLALALVFLKKFGVYILIGLGILGRKLIFKGKAKNS